MIFNVNNAFKPDDFTIFRKYKSFVVIGCSGSGKSTTADLLCKKFTQFKPIHLDDLFWNPNWQLTDKKVFEKRVARTISHLKSTNDSRYVIDGNYHRSAGSTIWNDIEVAIWLDYDFWIVFYRIIVRTFSRMITRKVICNGNVEPFSRIFTKESMPYYVWNAYDRYKERIPDVIRKFPNVKVIRIKSPYQFEYWFKNLL